MNGHPQFEEDFDLYALRALDREEEQALGRHLESCPDCSRKVEEARGRVALLGVAAPPQVPSPAARERLLRLVRSKPAMRPQPRPGALLRRLVPVFALIALALVIGLWREALENREMARSVQILQAHSKALEAETARARVVLEVLTAPDTLKVTLVAAEARAVPQGRAFYNSRKGLLFYAANLPQLAQDRTYQLWVVPAEGSPISAGIFQADARGNGEIMLPALPSGVVAKAFAITVEPSGGVPQPTGPKILIGVVS